ncbi:hypothetical protein [Metabacillus litoralis]|nr:hypothetical protein [Metabacillus litoralis]
MKKDDNCIEEEDYISHMLTEQITRICVTEEVEAIREENGQNSKKKP